MTKTLVEKLGLKPGHRALVLNAPPGYVDTLFPLPVGASVDTSGTGPYDFVQVFVHNKAEGAEYTPRAIQAVKSDGLLWFAYPKKSGSIKTDISRDVGWEPLRDAGWDGVTLISMDDTWSSFRVRPLADIKTRTQFRTERNKGKE
jgi:hypothetical protein